jgi:signal transduction histidine kinase
VEFVEALRAAARRHPQWVDAGLAVALALTAAPATLERSPGVLGWLCHGLMFLPLVWRRRAPVVVFWTVFALIEIVGFAGLDLPGTIIAAPAAIYAVARYRPRRYLWPMAIAVEAALVVAWWVSHEPWPSLIPVNAILIATALLGTNISTRRAYLEQLEERARRLERERDQEAQLATATERARIAREMHDVVAHHLAVIVALADAAALTATATPHAAADKMEKVAATGRDALGEMRRLLGLLHDDDPTPAGLAPQGGLVPQPGLAPQAGLAPQPGLDDIDRLVDQVRATGLTVALTREGVPGRWGPGAGLTVYRIVQEALTNTIKHAGPGASAHVGLRYTSTGVDVEVTDDGPYRPGRPTPPDAHGLTGMVERAASYGGRLEAGPLPSAGWRVHTRLTFDERAAAR